MDLLINTYGTRIRSSGERIVLVLPNTTKKAEYPARRIEKIIILRPSSISMGAVALALEFNIDIVYLGSFGKPIGRIFPSNPKGITELRRAQLSTANSTKAFELAKILVRGKSLNQISYLKNLQGRYQRTFSQEILQAETILQTLELVPDTPKGREQFFGIEGYIADKYFSAIKKLFHFPGRRPQGRDKFNSALNYGYGMLYVVPLLSSDKRRSTDARHSDPTPPGPHVPAWHPQRLPVCLPRSTRLPAEPGRPDLLSDAAQPECGCAALPRTAPRHPRRGVPYEH